VTDLHNGSYTATYTSDTFTGSVTVTARLDGQLLVNTASINQH
jgi:hypothetical protein